MEDRTLLSNGKGSYEPIASLKMSSNNGRKEGRKEGRKGGREQGMIVSRTEPWIIGMVERTLCRKVR